MAGPAAATAGASGFPRPWARFFSVVDDYDKGELGAVAAAVAANITSLQRKQSMEATVVQKRQQKEVTKSRVLIFPAF